MNRQIIYTCGFPKSGTTYLTRLLAEVLNSPSGGCMPSEDAKEVATEGQDRPGSYIVRKGHFVLIDDDGPGEVVPRPHRLAWRRLTNEKIVFLVRDPRDICISGAWHWRQKPEVFLERMIKGNVARCGRWDEYVKDWNNSLTCIDCHTRKLGKNGFYMVKYEDLVELPYTCLNILFKELGLDMNLYALRADDAIERQSFATRKAQIGDNPQELRRNNMRKGIVGDWKNHFTPEMNKRIWDEFGWMMERLGYEQD